MIDPISLSHSNISDNQLDVAHLGLGIEVVEQIASVDAAMSSASLVYLALGVLVAAFHVLEIFLFEEVNTGSV